MNITNPLLARLRNINYNNNLLYFIVSLLGLFLLI